MRKCLPAAVQLSFLVFGVYCCSLIRMSPTRSKDTYRIVGSPKDLGSVIQLTREDVLQLDESTEIDS